jgi:WD40 repeat protein
LRTLLAGVVVALAVAIVLGILALLQRNSARSATRRATSAALGSAANDRVEPRPDQALLLALSAYRSSPSADARGAVINALVAARKLGVSEFLHSDAQVLGVEFAPDGRTAAVAGGDGTLRLWDVPARKVAGELPLADGRPIAAVGFSRDGTKVAAGGRNGGVRIWRVQSHRPLGRILSAPGTIRSTAVSSDGRTAAAMDGRGHVWLWNVRTGSRRPLSGSGPQGHKTMLAFSPDGQTLAAGATATTDVEEATPGAVRLWRVSSGKPLGWLPSRDAVNGLAFTRDGRLVTVGYFATGRYSSQPSSYGEVQLWGVGRLRMIHLLKTRDAVDSLAFAPDGRTVAVGMDDGSIRLAVPEKGKWIGAPLRGIRTGATNVALGRDAHTVATAGAGDTTVRVWDLRRPPFARPIGSPDSDLSPLAFSGDGRTVATTSGYDTTVKLVDVQAETWRIPRWLAKAGWPQEVAMSPDGRTIAVRRENGSVRLLDLGSHDVVGRLPAEGSQYPGTLAFDPASQVLAVGDEEGTLRFWDVKDRKQLGKTLHTRAVKTAGFADGGRTLVTVSGDGYVERWNVAETKADGRPRRPVNGVSSAAISADGHTFAFDVDDGNVVVWDSTRAAPAAALARKEVGPATLALSADGQTLAVAGSKGTQLWDVRSRRPLGTPLAIGGEVLAFSPDGTVLAAAEGQVVLYKDILWRNATDLRRKVCTLVIGDLTKTEWAMLAPGLQYRKTCD